MDDTQENKIQALRQAIILSLLPSLSTNAWLRYLKIGSKDPTFQSSLTAIPDLKQNVKNVFDRLERRGRARLTACDCVALKNGNIIIRVIYKNLEVGVSDEISLMKAA